MGVGLGLVRNWMAFHFKKIKNKIKENKPDHNSLPISTSHNATVIFKMTKRKCFLFKLPCGAHTLCAFLKRIALAPLEENKGLAFFFGFALILLLDETVCPWIRHKRALKKNTDCAVMCIRSAKERSDSWAFQKQFKGHFRRITIFSTSNVRWKIHNVLLYSFDLRQKSEPRKINLCVPTQCVALQ